MAVELVSVEEAGKALGVSRSTVWRLIQRGSLPTVRRAGRRLVPVTALRKRLLPGSAVAIPAFSHNHPIFSLVGAGHGGGKAPGARDKHAILDE